MPYDGELSQFQVTAVPAPPSRQNILGLTDEQLKIVAAAREIIADIGWTQHNARGPRTVRKRFLGLFMREETTFDAFGYCMVGAIRAAANGNLNQVAYVNDEASQIESRLSEYIRKLTNLEYITVPAFNDAHRRTNKDVLAVFDAVLA